MVEVSDKLEQLMVIKRNGKKVPFDETKIALAIKKGFDSITDENDEPVSIENTVGNEALTTFGEYEDDAVHVRNDAKKCDYEVLLDNRKYEEVYRR